MAILHTMFTLFIILSDDHLKYLVSCCSSAVKFASCNREIVGSNRAITMSFLFLFLIFYSICLELIGQCPNFKHWNYLSVGCKVKTVVPELVHQKNLEFKTVILF